MANSKVLKAGLGYTIGNYLIKGLSFISIPIYTRLLSTADYGAFNNFMTYEGIFFIIVGCAIHSSYKSARYKYGLVREGAKIGKDYHSYVSTTIAFVLLCGLLWWFLANIFMNYLTGMLKMSCLSINLLVIYSVASELIVCFNEDISINYEYKSFLLISGINAIGTILISILLLLTILSKQRYIAMVWGASLPTIFVSIYVIFYFFKRARPNNFTKFIKWGLIYSLPIVPHGLSQVILSQFDKIMITNMVSLAATGIYSFSYNIYTILAVTFSSLDNVWSPWFYEKMRQRNYKNIRYISNIYMILMLFLTVELILVSPELIRILGQKNYWPAEFSAIPVVAGGYFAFLYTIPCEVEYYHEKTKWIAVATSVAAVVNIILNYIFIKEYGYITAAYTTWVTYMLYFGFHLWMAKKIQGWNLFSIKIILACSFLLIFVSAFSLVFIGNILMRWTLGIILGIIVILCEEKKYGLIVKKISIKRKSK